MLGIKSRDAYPAVLIADLLLVYIKGMQHAVALKKVIGLKGGKLRVGPDAQKYAV